MEGGGAAGRRGKILGTPTDGVQVPGGGGIPSSFCLGSSYGGAGLDDGALVSDRGERRPLLDQGCVVRDGLGARQRRAEVVLVRDRRVLRTEHRRTGRIASTGGYGGPSWTADW